MSARMDNVAVVTIPISRAYQPAIPMAGSGLTTIGGQVTRYSERNLRPLVIFRQLALLSRESRLFCEGH
jgi:hypothetical protein